MNCRAIFDLKSFSLYEILVYTIYGGLYKAFLFSFDINGC